MVEREGFEPSIPYYEYTHLAGARFRPLSHLSKNLQQKLLVVVQDVAFQRKYGAPNRSRTYNRQIRSLVLYPIELWAQNISKMSGDYNQ